ncbi:MAG TPA: hypothetical protein VMZ50_11470, partial [Phycisphaerae bacterium]|nr:hypothetical protein [Phycisphaerae bacterium]
MAKKAKAPGAGKRATKAAKRAKRGDVRARVESVSPDTAISWLQKTEESVDFKNRKLMPSLYNAYAEEMRRGDWDENGETIIISKEGYVLDGQHRLWAVVESGATIRCLVARGVDKDMFLTIDRGKGRSLGDVLRKGKMLTSALQWVHRYDRETMTAGTGRANSLTSKQAERLLVEQPDIEASLPHGEPLRHLMPKAAAVFCHFAFAKAESAEIADEFFRSLADGVGLKRGDPVLALRDKLFDRKREVN